MTTKLARLAAKRGTHLSPVRRRARNPRQRSIRSQAASCLSLRRARSKMATTKVPRSLIKGRTIIIILKACRVWETLCFRSKTYTKKEKGGTSFPPRAHQARVRKIVARVGPGVQRTTPPTSPHLSHHLLRPPLPCPRNKTQ